MLFSRRIFFLLMVYAWYLNLIHTVNDSNDIIAQPHTFSQTLKICQKKDFKSKRDKHTKSNPIFSSLFNLSSIHQTEKWE